MIKSGGYIPARWSAIMVFVIGAVCTIHAQCPNNNTVIAGGAITPPCPGTITVPCVQGGQYALVNVTNGYLYSFNTCAAGFDTQITLYNNTGGGSLGYNDDACGLQSTVNWTATFTGQLRVLVDQYNCGNNAICAPLQISCMLPPPPMTNDNCGTAIILPVFDFCLPQTFTNVGATNSGVPNPTCAYTAAARDVWFQFVAPPSGAVVIETGSITLTDGVMQLYGGTCGALTAIECDDDDGPGLMPMINRQCTPLTPGATYFIRFWGWGTATGIFSICVRSAASSTPQEDCNGGFTVCSNQTFNNNTSWTGCSTDLNGSNQGCLLGGEQQGTWYFFSPSVAGTIGFTIAPTANIDYDFALWGPLPVITCPPVGLPVRCSFASGFSTYSATGSYNTGLGNGAADFSEGAGGNGWVAPINVLPGEIYILYIDNWSATSQAFDLDWDLSTPGMLDCTVLPVELISFQGILLPEGPVRLDWITASEHNSSHFVVERSHDGLDFHPIGQLPAAGWTQTTTLYDLHDPAPSTGMNYYRLRQVDVDGTTAYSHIVPIDVAGTGSRLMVAPNPASTQAEVLMTGLPEAAAWRMTDTKGRLLMKDRIPNGTTRFVLPLAGSTTGVYFLRIDDREGVPLDITRFMVQ